MAFDGFINKSIINELKTCLLGGKIVKIHQPNKDELLFNIYSNSKKFDLDISINSSNCRINLTSDKKINPPTPTSFCMLLRKHLVGAKIINIDTIGFDRIIEITFETFNELNDVINKKLIIELMGKHSNVILLNDSNIIIDSIRHIVSNRNILPANPYSFLDSDKLNINEITLEKFKEIINNSSDTFVNTISSSFYGFSKTLIYYIINILNIDSNNILYTDISKFYNYVLELIRKINLLEVSCIEFSFNNKKDYVLIPCENASELKINYFVDTYYSSKEKNEYFENYRNNILRIILSILRKYEKRLININSKLEECNQMDKYKLYGELITANLYKLDPSKNVENVILENYYDNNNPVNIPLDIKYSVSTNAKRYFKKYSKLKNTLEIVSKQKYETKQELNYLESIIYSLNSTTSINEIDEIYLEIQENVLDKKIINKKNITKKIDNYSPIIINIDGYTILIGKNNKQNDLLTFKLSSKNDLWFHAKDIHGSHVVLKLDHDHSISDNIIEKCASIAAYYSKAKASTKVLVEYTFIKNIKKPKNSKPGFVTFSNYKTVLVRPYNYET